MATINKWPELTPSAVLGPTYEAKHLRVPKDRLLNLVQKLRHAYTAAERSLDNPTQTIRDHALACIVCYSFKQLRTKRSYDSFGHGPRGRGYQMINTISAIALEYSRAHPVLVQQAWSRAMFIIMQNPMVDRLLQDLQDWQKADYKRGQRQLSGDPKQLRKPYSGLPVATMRESMEAAVKLAYEAAWNSLESGLWDPLTVLAVFGVRHMCRAEYYDEQLLLRAVAVEDVWERHTRGDVTAEEAWKEARKSKSDGAKQR